MNNSTESTYAVNPNNEFHNGAYSVNTLNKNNTTYENEILMLPLNLDDVKSCGIYQISTNNTIVKDVEIVVPNKVVRVTFNDNTFEKAVCHPDDKFDLETAIGICIAKHLCGGSSKYNKLVNKALKGYQAKLKAEEEAKAKQERINVKRKKNHEKMLERKRKKAEIDRQNRIKEMAEAIVLANDIMNTKPSSIDNYPEQLNY